MTIHTLAHVDDDVVLGDGTVVRQFASITRGTVMGKNCSVAPHACLDGSTYGDNVVVSPGVYIGPGFIVESDVFIGPNVILCNDTYPESNKEGFDREWLLKNATVIVRRGASIGANATVLPGVEIGERVLVAAGSVVTRSVPADHIWTRDGKAKPKNSKRNQRMVPVSIIDTARLDGVIDW